MHLMGLALHDNASLRCFKIEKLCKTVVFFFIILPLDSVDAKAMILPRI